VDEMSDKVFVVCHCPGCKGNIKWTDLSELMNHIDSARLPIALDIYDQPTEKGDT
jgi:hypothetical protein